MEDLQTLMILSVFTFLFTFWLYKKINKIENKLNKMEEKQNGKHQRKSKKL